MFLDEGVEHLLKLVDDLGLEEPHDGVVQRVDDAVGQEANEASAHLQYIFTKYILILSPSTLLIPNADLNLGLQTIFFQNIMAPYVCVCVR